MALGTIGYMAPEQAAGERVIDGRADIYALGIVGYEILTGHPPFEAPNAQALLVAHLTEDAEPLTRARAEVPRVVSDAIARAIAKNPGDRWQTADLLRDALEEARMPTAQLPGFRLAGPTRRAKLIAASIAVAALAGGSVVASGTLSSPLDPNVVAVAPFDVIAPDSETRMLWREGIVDVLARKLGGGATGSGAIKVMFDQGFLFIDLAADIAGATFSRTCAVGGAPCAVIDILGAEFLHPDGQVSEIDGTLVVLAELASSWAGHGANRLMPVLDTCRVFATGRGRQRRG
jgi:hypothetical protein